MSLKKNIMYSGILTVSLYFLQFITYPYVSRILGVANLGLYNYYSGLATFFTVLSALGIPALGIREIAKVKDNGNKALDYTFSGLFLLNGFYSFISIIAFIVLSLFLAKTAEEWILVGLCITQILFNLFTVEWFFRGLEAFKYITIRTLLLRILFVACTFVFVNDTNDYVLYFALGTATVVLNALINWGYKKSFVNLYFVGIKNLKSFVRPSILLGIYYLLGTYYNTVFPFALKHFSGDVEVGFFTSAAKLILIILLIYNAYTQAMIPRISSLSTNKKGDAMMLINRSFEILFIIAAPIIVLVSCLSRDIVLLVFGPGFDGSIIPMIISAPVILVCGIDQIISNQILLPFNRDMDIIISYTLGIVLGLLSATFVPTTAAVSFAIAWLVTESSICFIQLYILREKYSIKVKWLYTKYIVACIPLFALCWINAFLEQPVTRILFDVFIVIVYTHIIYKYVLKVDEYISIISVIKRKLIR